MGLLDLLPSGLISPKLGTSMLKSQIENRLGFKIDWYHMHYNALENKVFFVIPVGDEKRKYPFENAEKLCELVSEQLKSKLKDGDTIDYLILKHGENVEYEIYYRDGQQNKEQLNGTL